MLEKGNYIPWESRFRRFLDNQLEEGEMMWHSIQHGPYKRPLVPNPHNPQEQILEPLSKMTEGDKKKYIAHVHASSKAHEQVSHVKRKTIIQTMDDDQIDSSITFDDPYMDNNGGASKHDSIDHE
ncbi:hypothetical protein Tco_1269805 [Tanacetum coccineum]